MPGEAVARHTGEAGERIGDEASLLRQIGINPDEISAEPNPLSDFLQERARPRGAAAQTP